jgi:hypothetical protein
MTFATLLAIAFSGALLILLGARDPKRVRNARHRSHDRAAEAPLPRAIRRACGWSVLAPGVALGIAGQWWAFLIWLGAVTAFGWAIAIGAAFELRRAPVSTNG